MKAGPRRQPALHTRMLVSGVVVHDHCRLAKAMARKKTVAPSQTELLDVTVKLRTGPCVPALREAVKAWKAGGYKGVDHMAMEQRAMIDA